MSSPSPLRIAVNLRQFRSGKIGGMENYVRQILAGLQHHSLTVWALKGEADNVRAFAPKAKVIAVEESRAVAAIDAALKAGEYDVLFCPLLTLEPLAVDRPCAVMMPDIQHEFFPEFFSPEVLAWRRDNYCASALLADVLFTLSEHAKATIVERYRIAPEKVVVVHLDAGDEFRAPAPARPPEAFQRLRLPPKYLYFPANFWPHKNHANALRALRIALDAGEGDLHLVLSGSPEGSGAVRDEARRLGLEDCVRFAGYLDKALVPEVYRNAAALLFVTKFEGFGIPLLEAFHCGTPAITSHSGSCVEVAGDAAVLADPESPESIAEGILRVLRDPALRRDLTEKGAARAKEFSWKGAVAATERALAAAAAPGFRRPTRIEVEEWPRIGLVTPTRNMARFLEETIGSVLSQGYPNLDYVVMDGASKDGSVEILRKYDGRLRWRSEPDKGQGHAINKGWHAVTGDIFGYLNADDTLLPGALGTIAGHFKRNPRAGLIYGEAYHVDAGGAVIGRYPTRPFSLETLQRDCYICQPAAFLRREAFARAGMITESLHFALDYDLWIRIAKMYPVRKADEYLATSRMYADNKTLSSRGRVYREILSTVRRHFGYVPHEWVNGLACYLLDGKDQFFDRSRPTLGSHALSLLLGLCVNPLRVGRYWSDWRRGVGIGAAFTGRWDDGWISRCYEQPLRVEADSTSLRIKGKHAAPIGNLTLRMQLDGRPVEEKRLRAPGPFVWEAPVPPEARGAECRLTIESNRTWRPMRNGDFRPLCCIIDSVELSADGTRR